MFSDWWWSSGAEANKEDGFEIKNSLRFRGLNSQTIERTFSSTFDASGTLSAWKKMVDIKPFLKMLTFSVAMFLGNMKSLASTMAALWR